MNIYQRTRARSTEEGALVSFLSQTSHENVKRGKVTVGRASERWEMGLNPRGCWHPERQDDSSLPGREVIKMLTEAFCPFKGFSTSLCKSNLQHVHLEK